MKNIVSTLLLMALVATTAYAQVAFEAGLNESNLSIKSPTDKLPTSFKRGAAFGLVVDMEMETHIFFETGIYYENYGAIIKTTPDKGEFDINAFTFPLNLEYKSGEKCGSRFFFGIGPYISRNISGSYEYSDSSKFEGLRYHSADLTIGDNFKEIDIGAGINIGYVFKKHTYARARYQVGIVNLNMDGDAKIKSSNAGIDLGYYFGNCRGRGFTNSFRVKRTNHWRGLRKGHWSTRTRLPRYPKN